MSHIVHRTHGDIGPEAAIRFRLVDERTNAAVTSGTVKIHVDGMFEGAATHDVDGWWEYAPVAGDIVWTKPKPGVLLMEVSLNGVRLPGREGGKFVVRRQTREPTASS